MFPELAAVRLELKTTKSNQIPAWLGKAVHGEFLAGLKRLNPVLSAAIHDGSGMKPFTTSNLDGMSVRGSIATIRPGQKLSIRFSTLHPQLSALLINALVPQWVNDGLKLHDQPLQVTAVRTTAEEDVWCDALHFDQLLDEAGETDHLRMEFVSPTAFRATARHYIPLPQPELVFASLLDRWNRFAPFQLPRELYEQFRSSIAVEEADIHTDTVNFARGGRTNVIGFTGRVTFRLFVKDREARRQIAALAAFARFSGVGAKTTMGLGQARLLR